MLRKGTKENFIRILQDVLRLCESSLNREAHILISALQESQDAVISVGTGLEKSVDNPMEIISKMESLCEAFYMLSINMENREVYGSQIKELLTEIIEKVSDLPVSYQIVFFPYKAEMWDSLESIWLACKDNPSMDCKVVPIPYYNFDAEQNQWKFHYELERFPEYVPVVHYADYDLSEHADVAFIHNPYDEYNHVTHVHSDYYSYNLKKYVNKLFYVPYYVTSGFIADNHKSLSVYEHADYIVVQSEAFKEGLKETGYAHKALVMGSPKLDRVIRMNGNPDRVPEEWKTVLKGKKSLMLNTSLSQFLRDGEIYLQKIAQVIEVVKNREDVILIWRPHPLLRSTIESMRPELISRYEVLRKQFLDAGVGIIDTTPDVENTVAVADAYIGEASSSVVNLFEAVGKPVFILNNHITEDFDSKQRSAVLLFSCNKVGENYYCTIGESSDLFVVKNNKWENVTSIAKFQAVARWKPAFINSTIINKELYFAPYFSEHFYSYDLEYNHTRRLSDKLLNGILNYKGVVSYRHKVFYIPNIAKSITEYDTINEVWTEHKEPIQAMQKGITEHIFEDVADYFVIGQYMWLTNLYSNRVICFDMETAEYKRYDIGNKDSRYSAIVVDKDNIYISDACTGKVYVWNYVTNEIVNIYTMPKDYHVHINDLGRRLAHAKLWLTNGWLYAVPNTANMLVKIELLTDKVYSVAKEFWTDALEPANFYHPSVNMIANFSQMVDDHILLVQKRRDASLIEIETHTGKYRIHHPMLAEKEVENLLCNAHGFEKIYKNGELACRESKYFSLKGFMDDLVHECLSNEGDLQTVSLSRDKTCGEKVYEFLRKCL